MKTSERIYRWLLRAYPRDFREEYGEEMSLLFRSRETDGSFKLWLQVIRDLVFHAPKEHWGTLKQDLRYAARTLLGQPTFAATVIAILALGIGASSTIFSAIDAVLLRDAPVSDPDSLVDVYTTSGSNLYSRSSYPDYFDLRDSGTFASLAAYTEVPITMEANGQPEPIAGQLVSSNYFEVLGIKIRFGRGFTPDDDRIGAPVRATVISHALWQRVFNADPSFIGQTIRLNSNPYTLIGVAPPGFAGPILGIAADVWVPTALQPEVSPPAASVRRSRGHSGIFDLRSSRGLRMVGRLPRGASTDQVASRAEVISSRLETAYPNTNRNRRFILVPLSEGRGLRVEARPVLRQLAVAVMMVLLVACVNVASLLLARAVSREREVAVRLAIGASRARLVRQWLTESVFLGILGSIGALIVARVSIPLLHTFVIPEAVDLSVNVRVLGFALAVGVGSGLLFGLAPVFQALRPNRTATLSGRGADASGTHAARMRGGLVILQIAVTFVLLVAAGLFLRTLENAYSIDPGYQVDQTLVASLNLEAHGYFEGGSRGADAGLAMYEQILSRVEALPGVVSASAARMTVLTGNARSTDVSMDGRPIVRGNALGVRANIVSNRYFETMNIPILRGRSFNASDGRGTPRVTIVTKSLANRIWPNEDPIGKSLRDGDNQLQIIVGVVPDTVYTSTLERGQPPTYYLLLAQNYESGVTLHVRAARNPMSLVPAIREAVREVDTQLAVERPELLRDVLDRSLSKQRMMSTLVGLFGAVALILAVLGLYGVMAHAAARRTPEIGIRLAMGAKPSSIVTLLLGQGLRLLGIGVAIGLAGAFFGTRYIEAQLFGVTANDPLTFVGGCVVLTIAGITASVIPALRATRVDPVIAMGKHIINAALWFGLISLSLCLVNPAAAQVDQQRADAYFKEAATICQRDGGRLWGVSLCGPMVFADARTRTFATNQPSPTGELPRTFGFANAPVEWGGSRWAAYVWDFTTSFGDAFARGQLMLHELFHRIQPDLGLITLSGNNAHLDTVEGRVWLRLEWRALARALGQSGEDRKRAVSDAAAFRLTRRSQFANAAENERVEEIREGLAQYTGTVATAASQAEAVASALEQLAAAEQHETFLQQAYTTGLAYGILLDTASPDWRRRVRSDSDLGQMLIAALDVTPAANAVEASARYGGAELRAAEQTRAEQRMARLRELRNRFVDGPVLVVPSGGGGTFNAVGATPIPGEGTVYVLPYRQRGEWGTLEAMNGVLINDDGTRRLPGPVRIDGATLTGDGWTVTVAPGWTVRSGPRSGDYRIIRDPQ